MQELNGWGRVLLEMPSSRTRDNRHKLEHSKFYANVRKKLFTLRRTEQWSKLPREVVKSALSGVEVGTHLGTFLGNLA